MKTIIFDIDGTLANIDHRLHYAKNKDYKRFFEQMHLDEPRKAEQQILQALWHKEEYHIIMLTGRPNTYREKTKMWLAKHSLYYHRLIMRPKEHYKTPDYKWKTDLINALKDTGIEITAIFEDRQTVVNELRKNGYTVFQSNAWKETNGIVGTE